MHPGQDSHKCLLRLCNCAGWGSTNHQSDDLRPSHRRRRRTWASVRSAVCTFLAGGLRKVRKCDKPGFISTHNLRNNGVKVLVLRFRAFLKITPIDWYKSWGLRGRESEVEGLLVFPRTERRGLLAITGLHLSPRF
jgi:hypothetical protein